MTVPGQPGQHLSGSMNSPTAPRHLLWFARASGPECPLERDADVGQTPSFCQVPGVGDRRV